MSDYGGVTNCLAPNFTLDPDATDDFEFPLATDLGDDTLVSVTFVLPDGLTEVSHSNTTTTATVFLTGAECGISYRVTLRYTTAMGRTRDKTFVIVGKEG